MAQSVSYSQFESMVYSTLMQPEAESPNRLQVWHAANAQVQLLYLAAQNTDVNWGAETHAFSTVAGQRDYQMPFTDFGKDVAIYTKDSATSYHQAREVRRVNFQDANLYYAGPATALGGGLHSDACAAFYRDTLGNAYLRFLPTPNASCEYEVLYKTDSVMFGATGDGARFPQFIHLLRFRTCLELLPYCKWANLAEEQEGLRMERLALTLGKQDERYTKEFEAWIENDHTVGSFYRLGYAEEYL